MKKSVAAFALGMFSSFAVAQVTVSDAWVRATVPAQKVTGAFMQLKSDRPSALVSAQSPAAAAIEIHEMRMDGDMARMRAVTRVNIAGGQTVKLQPGGYHLMLLDLKQSLQAGTYVPIKLTFESADKTAQEVEIKAEVRALNSHQR